MMLVLYRGWGRFLVDMGRYRGLGGSSVGGGGKGLRLDWP